KADAPWPVEETRTPSTSTRAWVALPPRRKTVLALPGPPVRAASMPAWRASRSTRSGAWLRSISSRVRTVTEAGMSLTARSTRLAVTWTASRVRASWAALMAGRARAMAAARAAARWIGYIDAFSLVRSPAVRLTRGDKEGMAGAGKAGTAAPSPTATCLRATARGRSPDPRPVSGLARGREAIASGRPPSHAGAQWRDGRFCGPTVAGAAPELDRLPEHLGRGKSTGCRA